MDITLLALVALCQGAVGFLGFWTSIHTISDACKRRAQVYFILISLIGIICVVWSGVRSDVVMTQIVQLLRGSSTPAKVEIVSISPVLPDAEHGFVFNLKMRNTGGGEALDLYHSAEMIEAVVPEHPALKDEQKFEDDLYWGFLRQQKLHEAEIDSTNAFEPDAEAYFSLPDTSAQRDRLTGAAISKWIKPHLVYMLARLQWVDQKTQKLRVTEGCYYWRYMESVHFCVVHNRTYSK